MTLYSKFDIPCLLSPFNMKFIMFECCREILLEECGDSDVCAELMLSLQTKGT